MNRQKIDVSKILFECVPQGTWKRAKWNICTLFDWFIELPNLLYKKPLHKLKRKLGTNDKKNSDMSLAKVIFQNSTA